MFRRPGFWLILLSSLPLFSAAVAAAGYPPLFTTEAKAARHCPADKVVWLDPPSGLYRFKGQAWYARTNRGAYACKAEADRVGDRPAP